MKVTVKQKNNKVEFIKFIFEVGILIVILPITALFYFIKSLLNFIQLKHLEISKMECPNCKSSEIRIQPSNCNTLLNIKSKRVGICQECGFDYQYYTEKEIKDIKIKTIINLVISIILLILSLIIFISFFSDTYIK